MYRITFALLLLWALPASSATWEDCALDYNAGLFVEGERVCVGPKNLSGSCRNSEVVWTSPTLTVTVRTVVSGVARTPCTTPAGSRFDSTERWFCDTNPNPTERNPAILMRCTQRPN